MARSSSTSWVTTATRRRRSAAGGVAHVDAAEAHGAGGDVPQPHEQPAEGRLAAAGAADDAERRAGGEVEVEVDEDVACRRW